MKVVPVNIALFIGRFQPLHKGHYRVIQQLKEQYTPVIGIGSSEKMNTFDNPLSFSERSKIVKNCFPGIDVFAIPDRDDDQAWVEQIVEEIRFDVVIAGNDWTQRCFEDAGYDVEEPEMHRRDIYRGTEIRNMVQEEDESWKSLVPSCSLELIEQFNFEERLEQM